MSTTDTKQNVKDLGKASLAEALVLTQEKIETPAGAPVTVGTDAATTVIEDVLTTTLETAFNATSVGAAVPDEISNAVITAVVDKTIPVVETLAIKVVTDIATNGKALVEKGVTDFNANVSGFFHHQTTAAPIEDTIVFSNDPVANQRLIDALGVLKQPGLTSPNAIAIAQIQFYNSLVRGIVNTTPAESETFLNTILAYIEKNYSGMFSPLKLFRSVNLMSTLSINQRKEFEIILRILVDTADPLTRIGVAKSMNWSQIMASINTSYALTLIDRLQNFYRI